MKSDFNYHLCQRIVGGIAMLCVLFLCSGCLAPLLMNTGHVEVSGDIVDEDGKPLRDVTFFVTRTQMGNYPNAKQDIRKQQVDGTFAANVSAAISVQLDFEKEGYIAESIFIDAAPPEETAKDIQPYLTSSGRLKVTLMKKGTLTHLQEYVLPVEFNLDGSATVVDLSTLGHTNGRNRPDDPKVIRVKSLDPKELPASAFYVTADINKETGTFIRGPEGTALGERAVLTHLVIVGKNSGIQRAAYSPDKLVEISLRRAPSDGYKTDCVIDRMDDSRNRPGEQWFYLKITGKYARCRIDLGKISSDGKTTNARLFLSLQPDGTTNLETNN